MGSGHVLDMISRVKANRVLRPSNQNTFKSNNRESIYTKNTQLKTTYNFPEISKTELEKIKIQIRGKARKENKKQRITWGIVLAILATTIIINFKL